MAHMLRAAELVSLAVYISNNQQCVYTSCFGMNTYIYIYMYFSLRRRCPGPYNDQKSRFMWRWYDYRTLQHVESGRCLSVNVTYVNGSNVPEVKLLLVVCDRYESKQHWECKCFAYYHIDVPASVPDVL